MTRAWSVTRVLMRASLLGALQYRGDFFFSNLQAAFNVVWALVPLLVVFRVRPSIAGWSVNEALLVSACFTMLKGLLEGFMTPSLQRTIDQIRLGTFDFALIKPIDAQLYASVNSIDLGAIGDFTFALAIAIIALVRLHYLPTIAQLSVTLVLTLSAAAILYSLNLAALAVAFFVARIDNLAYLLNSLFDAARWPSSVFRGALRLVFTFVLPLGLMTTFPPLALLGRLDLRSIALALSIGVASLALSRLWWLRAMRAYHSAGG